MVYYYFELLNHFICLSIYISLIQFDWKSEEIRVCNNFKLIKEYLMNLFLISILIAADEFDGIVQHIAECCDECIFFYF